MEIVPGKLEAAMDSGKTEGIKENQRKTRRKGDGACPFSVGLFSFKSVINLWLILSPAG